MKVNCRLLVVIPTLNVQDYIMQIIHDLKSLNLGLDFLVVDYGSSDRTKILLVNNKIPHLALPIKTSYYKALQLGLEYGVLHKYDGVIEYDSKGCFRSEDIKNLISTFEANNPSLVLTTRYTKHGNVMEKDRFKIFVLKLVIRLITGKTILDPMLRFRIYGFEAMTFFSENLENEPATDTIAQLIRGNLTFKEVAIHQENGEALDYYNKENRLTS